MTNGNGQKTEFLPLETGDYLVRMNRIEGKDTRNGGRMLSAGFEIVSGDSKGRLVFHNFIIDNKSDRAVEIGVKQLDSFLAAVGGGSWSELGSDETELANFTELPFTANLGIEEAKDYVNKDGIAATSKARNKITKFMTR